LPNKTLEALRDKYLHKEELETAGRFPHPKRCQSYVTGRLAAKLALMEHTPEPSPASTAIRSGVFNQPLIVSDHTATATLRVSISHSENCAVALVFHAGHPMGIDVERVRKDGKETVLASQSEHELHILNTLGISTQDQATLIWTAKESLGKVLTTGMMTPTDVYAISSIAPQQQSFGIQYKNFAQYRSVIIPGKRDWLALTLPARTTLLPNNIPWS
jgi:phosphopantetheinyl transferase